MTFFVVILIIVQHRPTSSEAAIAESQQNTVLVVYLTITINKGMSRQHSIDDDTVVFVELAGVLR